MRKELLCEENNGSVWFYYNGFVDDSAQTGAGIELVYENVGFEKDYNVNNINLADFGF